MQKEDLSWYSYYVVQPCTVIQDGQRQGWIVGLLRNEPPKGECKSKSLEAGRRWVALFCQDMELQYGSWPTRVNHTRAYCLEPAAAPASGAATVEMNRDQAANPFPLFAQGKPVRLFGVPCVRDQRKLAESASCSTYVVLLNHWNRFHAT